LPKTISLIDTSAFYAHRVVRTLVTFNFSDFLYFMLISKAWQDNLMKLPNLHYSDTSSSWSR